MVAWELWFGVIDLAASAIGSVAGSSSSIEAMCIRRNPGVFQVEGANALHLQERGVAMGPIALADGGLHRIKA